MDAKKEHEKKAPEKGSDMMSVKDAAKERNYKKMPRKENYGKYMQKTGRKD